jgi:hypothetical protein
MLGMATEQFDEDDRPLREDENGRPKYIYTSRLLRSHMALYEYSRHTKTARRFRRLARVAKRFEVQQMAALDASGHEARKREVEAAAMAYTKEVIELLERMPSTIPGVLIFARAAEAARMVGPALGYQQDYEIARGLDRKVTDGVLRIAGQVLRRRDGSAQ